MPPRRLAIMGSGATTPTMIATHGEVFGRLGEEVAAVLLGTPYAFQENAGEVSAKAKTYFRKSIGCRIEVTAISAAAIAAETALARLRARLLCAVKSWRLFAWQVAHGWARRR